MKLIARIGLFGFGLVAVSLLLAFAFPDPFRSFIRSLVKTVDNPIQHEFVEAARIGDVEKMEEMLHKGASVDGEATYSRSSIYAGPALGDAILFQQPEVVRWLLDRGAQVNQIIATDTPLDLAEQMLAEPGNQPAALAIVELLRARGGKKRDDLHPVAKHVVVPSEP